MSFGIQFHAILEGAKIKERKVKNEPRGEKNKYPTINLAQSNTEKYLNLHVFNSFKTEREEFAYLIKVDKFSGLL